MTSGVNSVHHSPDRKNHSVENGTGCDGRVRKEGSDMATARARGTGSIFKPKGSSYWWVAYLSGGKRRYESTKSTRKGDAQSLLTDRLGAVQKGVVVTPKMGKKTIGEALKSVVDDLKM